MFSQPVPSHGPTNARILLLAEAPGEREVERGQPLVGPSGHELRRMLNTVGVDLNDCRKVNVFSYRPLAGNDISRFGVAPGHPDGDVSLGPLTNNPRSFMDRRHRMEVERCHKELVDCRPHIVVALGNTATWALGLGTGINALRGSLQSWRGIKVLPTYHPAAVLRQWDLRPVAIADLAKAERESHSPDLHYDNTTLWLMPTLDELREFDEQYMSHTTRCAADIEIKRGQIDCISFAPTPEVSLSIPFWTERADGLWESYWPTLKEELVAWGYVRKWLEDPHIAKVFQNGLFDLQHLQPYCSPRNCTEDTMLMSHSLWSEMSKGLGFLGSIHANYPAWKSLRTYKKEDDWKRDD